MRSTGSASARSRPSRSLPSSSSPRLGQVQGREGHRVQVKVKQPKEAFVVDSSKKAVLKPKSEKKAPAAPETTDETAETTEA